MKKLWMITVVTIIMAFCMTGCGEEQDEFVDYVNGSARAELAKLESQAKESYASVTGDNATDNETSLQELSTNTTELTKQAVDKAVSIGNGLKDEELKKVHNIYISSLKNFQSGVELIVEIIQNSDSEQMDKVNELMNKANEESANYQTELQKLADSLGVTLETKKE